MDFRGLGHVSRYVCRWKSDMGFFGTVLVLTAGNGNGHDKSNVWSSHRTAGTDHLKTRQMRLCSLCAPPLQFLDFHGATSGITRLMHV